MSLEVAKYMTQKWFEDRIELMGIVVNLSREDLEEWVEWYNETSEKFNEMEQDMVKRAEWMDKHNQ